MNQQEFCNHLTEKAMDEAPDVHRDDAGHSISQVGGGEGDMELLLKHFLNVYDEAVREDEIEYQKYLELKKKKYEE